MKTKIKDNKDLVDRILSDYYQNYKCVKRRLVGRDMYQIETIDGKTLPFMDENPLVCLVKFDSENKRLLMD